MILFMVNGKCDFVETHKDSASLFLELSKDGFVYELLTSNKSMKLTLYEETTLSLVHIMVITDC